MKHKNNPVFSEYYVNNLLLTCLEQYSTLTLYTFICISEVEGLSSPDPLTHTYRVANLTRCRVILSEN